MLIYIFANPKGSRKITKMAGVQIGIDKTKEKYHEENFAVLDRNYSA